MSVAASHTPALIRALEPLLHHYGYLAVGVLVMIEDFGVPVPGETTLVAAAFLAGSGQLNIVVLAIVAFIAAVIGDNIGFAIGMLGGRPLVERLGSYVFLTPKHLDSVEAFFSRYGGRVVVVARFIEGLRQLNGIVAGMSRMRWHRFVVSNAFGAALWVGTWTTLGYFGGTHIDVLRRYELVASITAAAVVIVYVGYRIVRYRQKRQNHRR